MEHRQLGEGRRGVRGGQRLSTVFTSRAEGGPGRPIRLLIAVQLTAIVVLGVVTVARFHVYAPVDEEAHFAYVESVADHGRLPVAGRDRLSRAVAAVDSRGALSGTTSLNWEAFQPPLYYAIAAPVFLLAGANQTGVYLLRAFDLVLLLAGLAILWRLAVAVFRARWHAPFACALAVVLWPGVLVRAITVSDAALEIPIVALFVLCAWHASVRRDPRLLVGAGAVLGLAVLTRLTLVTIAPQLLVPLVAVLRDRKDRLARGAAALAVVLPLALVTPWIISNEQRYHALTAGSIAKRVQGPELRIDPADSGVKVFSSHLWWLPRAVYPTEWWPEYGKPVLAVLLFGLALALVVTPLAAVVRDPRSLWSLEGAMLAAPLPIGLLGLVVIGLVESWPTMLSRYVNPMLPLLAMFTGWACGRRGGDARAGSAAAGIATAVAVVLWIYGAGAFYFTHVGSSLGIHA